MKVVKPRLSILDPRFKYIPAAKTDVARTFEAERQRLQREKQQNEIRDGKVLKLRD